MSSMGVVCQAETLDNAFLAPFVHHFASAWLNLSTKLCPKYTHHDNGCGLSTPVLKAEGCVLHRGLTCNRCSCHMLR